MVGLYITRQRIRRGWLIPSNLYPAKDPISKLAKSGRWNDRFPDNYCIGKNEMLHLLRISAAAIEASA